MRLNFNPYLTDWGSSLSILLWELKWWRAEKNPNWSNFFCFIGRKHWNYTVCQQDRRKPRLLFFFSLFSLSWALPGGRAKDFSDILPVISSYVSFLEASIKSPWKHHLKPHVIIHTSAYFWFPAQGTQTLSVNKWAIPGASRCCHQTQTAFVLLDLKKKC